MFWSTGLVWTTDARRGLLQMITVQDSNELPQETLERIGLIDPINYI